MGVGGGGGGLVLILHSRFFFSRQLYSASQMSVICASSTVFLSQPFLVHDFGESRIPTSIQIPCPVKTFSFSRIPLCILVKSRVPKIPFQGKALETSDLMLSLLTKLYQRQSTILQMFYLTSETETNNYCKIATSKQKKALELVHNSEKFSTTYFAC